VSSGKDSICYVSLNDIVVNDFKGSSRLLPIERCDVYQAVFGVVNGDEVIIAVSSLGLNIWKIPGDKLLFPRPKII
jgi:hypothetical protein